MFETEQLTENINALASAAAGVSPAARIRFYYLVLLEVCELMKPEEFAAALRVAGEQLRRPRE